MNYKSFKEYMYLNRKKLTIDKCMPIFLLVDADDFLLSCESGRKMCYFIPVQPDSHSLPELIPLNFQITSSCYRYYVYAQTGTGISYDPTENRVYWTDECGDVYRAFLNNGSQQLVIRNPRGLVDMEIDIVGRNIYFADQYDNSIRVARLDGSYQAVIVNVQSPQGLALDSVSG